MSRLLPASLLLLLSVLCYTGSLFGDMVFDDIAAIRDNRDVRPHTPLANLFRDDYWGTPLHKEQSHKSYRPLTVLTFRLNFALHGLRPFGYHVINVALHACVTLLFYRLCLHLLPPTPSLVAGALFAVHPIHTEAVSGIVGRAELLSAAAFLCALLQYMHRTRHKGNNVWSECGLTSLFAVLGLLCKEQAITVLGVCCAYELTTPKNLCRVRNIRRLMLGRGVVLRDKLRRMCLLATVAYLSLYARWAVTGKHMPHFSRFDNPASVAQFPGRHLTHHYLVSFNAWLLLFPSALCCDWSGSSVPALATALDPRNAATLLFYGVLVCGIRGVARMDGRTARVVIMGGALLAFPFLPASNLLFPVGFVVAERVLYIPSMGLCLVVAHGWDKILARDNRFGKCVAAAGIILLIAVHALKTVQRNRDWSSESNLYSSGLRVNPNNAKLHNNMGQVMENTKRYEEALAHYHSATRIEPEDVRGYLNVGRVLTSLRRFGEAEDIYRKAKSLIPGRDESQQSQGGEWRVGPNHLQLFVNLASLIAQNESRLREADELYLEALTLRSDFSNAYLNRGDVLLKMNRSQEAETMYHRALEYDNLNPDLHYNLGIVLMDQGRNKEALEQFNKALDIEPDHEKSLELSAILMQESGTPNQRQLARARLERIVDRGGRESTERVYINLGLVAVENKNFQSAEEWFRKALLRDARSREALFNLALLLSERRWGGEEEALSLLHTLMEHYPGHVSGLLLLADINVNYLRNLDAAEQCYLRVLQSDPSNPKAAHNLCVLRFERQDYPGAEQCFSRIRPDTPQVRRHLRAVRDILLRGVS